MMIRRGRRGVKPSPALGATSSGTARHQPSRTNRSCEGYPGSFLTSSPGSFLTSVEGSSASRPHSRRRRVRLHHRRTPGVHRELARHDRGHRRPPTIADFDGDGRVEFASAGATAYNVFDPDCRGTPDPQFCPSLTTTGVAWSQPSQDLSSNVTGSSVFGFDGDGRAEIVYGDECFTRVYDGRTGTVYYSRYRTSCT
jgi:hypothetical protein